MNMKKNRSGIVILAITFIVAAAGLAFAHGGYGGGYGGHMMGPGMMGSNYDGYMMGSGYGGYMMGPGMMGPGYGGSMMGYGYGPYANGGNRWGNLSREQADKFQASQEHFYNATRDLRQKLYDKQFALNSELNSGAPDQSRALELQKEVSKLRSELDQKILQHQFELHKILPDDNQH